MTCSRPSNLPCSNLPMTSSPVSHWPAGLMPTCVISYLSASNTDSTERADIRETACSPERPPKITAILRRECVVGVMLPFTNQLDFQLQFDAAFLFHGLACQIY